MSQHAKDLILNLLNRNPKKRLGASAKDATELKDHPFFKDVNWEEISLGKHNMPKVPINTNFDQDIEAEQQFLKTELES